MSDYTYYMIDGELRPDRMQVARQYLELWQGWWDAVIGGYNGAAVPDISGESPMYTDEKVDEIIKSVDYGFQREVDRNWTWWRRQRGIEFAPRFDRLLKDRRQRLTFAQDTWRVLKGFYLPDEPDPNEIAP